MNDEIEVVRPLDAEEVKDAIAFTIAQALRGSLDKTCHLYGISYPRFKASWRVEVTMSRTPGEPSENDDTLSETINGTLLTQEFVDNTATTQNTNKVFLEGQHKTVEVKGEIPYTPPNVVRKQHGMPVPTMVRWDDGTTEQKAVMFKRREGFAKVKEQE